MNQYRKEAEKIVHNMRNKITSRVVVGNKGVGDKYAAIECALYSTKQLIELAESSNNEEALAHWKSIDSELALMLNNK